MRTEKRIDTFISFNRKKELIESSEQFALNQTPIDFGDKCTECEKDTSFGSGLFVNRIPSTMEHESPDGEFELRDGYMCWECQQVECEQCPIGNLTLDYQIVDGTILWPDCLDNQITMNKVMEDPDNGFFHFVE